MLFWQAAAILVLAVFVGLPTRLVARRTLVTDWRATRGRLARRPGSCHHLVVDRISTSVRTDRVALHPPALLAHRRGGSDIEVQLTQLQSIARPLCS